MDELTILYPSVDEEVLELIHNQAQDFILDYCNLDEIPSELNGVLLAMCQESLNRLHSEGISVESAGGSSIQFLTDYSSGIYRRLKKHKHIRTV